MNGLRLLGVAALLASLWATAATAAVPLLRDYRHTSWRAGDGAPAQVSALAQTRDGWLWLGTADGLYRFDGIAFERVVLPARGMLTRALINTLHADDNGDLWIGYVFEGLSVLRANGSVEDLPPLPGPAREAIASMARDGAGALWVIGNAGLYQLLGTPGHYRWRAAVDGAAWASTDARSLRRDQNGDLWASFDNRVWRQDRASGAFVPAGPPGARGALMQSPDGRMWAEQGAGLVLVAPPRGPARLPRSAGSNQHASSWSGQFDRAGNLWKLHCPNALCLLPAASQSGAALDPAGAGERGTDPAGLSGLNAEQVMEDREGNVWVATTAGLDRYQPNHLLQSGLPAAVKAVSLAVDADGAVWAADAGSGGLWRLDPGHPPVLQAGRYARVVGTARDGALLAAGKRSIERSLHGIVTQIPLPPGRDGQAADLTVLGTLDDGKVLWMASMETGLMGYVDGRWQPRSAFNLPPKIVISAAGAPGQLWLADGDGGLSLYDNGKLTRYDATVAGIASAVFAGSQVLVAGERGLAVLEGGVLRLLTAERPDVLRNISGMAITPDGDRWFNGIHGVVHVRGADWQRAIGSARDPLRYTLLDLRDGYPGQAANANRLPSVVQGSGGQLWFAGTTGVVRLDPRAMRRNLVAPGVQVVQVRTASASHAPTPGTGTVQLPPAAQDFSVAFTAPALRRPEDVRYAWRLDGVDAAWVDGGNRRIASYTKVAPGRYLFRVRATNEDGVTGSAEAVQAITIAPTILQSAWFKALCALLLMLAGMGLYRYRIAVLTARLSEQLQVRASERERIARTLHDTYLQSVHALMLRVGAMAQSLPADSPTRVRLETVLADASNAVVEGRDQVEQLRAGGATADTLEHVLARSAGPLRQCYPDVAYNMNVTGTPRALAPAVLLEAGQVAAEALRNAFIHADAAQIDVCIDYGKTFSVAVRDDGKGLADDVRRVGYRSGHWGLLGMRERAKAINARLTVASAAGNGTAITLALPGALAYDVAGAKVETRFAWFSWKRN